MDGSLPSRSLPWPHRLEETPVASTAAAAQARLPHRFARDRVRPPAVVGFPDRLGERISLRLVMGPVFSGYGRSHVGHCVPDRHGVGGGAVADARQWSRIACSSIGTAGLMRRTLKRMVVIAAVLLTLDFATTHSFAACRQCGSGRGSWGLWLRRWPGVVCSSYAWRRLAAGGLIRDRVAVIGSGAAAEWVDGAVGAGPRAWGCRS